MKSPRRFRRLAPLGLGLALLLSPPPCALGQPVELYNARLGGTPDQQGWLFQFDDPETFNPLVTQRLEGDKAVLDSSQNINDRAGYSLTLIAFGTGPDRPKSLNRNTGYTFHFTISVPQEAHARRDRAGVSVIVISQDLLGIELGFWRSEIFAQSAQSFMPKATLSCRSIWRRPSSTSHFMSRGTGIDYPRGPTWFSRGRSGTTARSGRLTRSRVSSS